jgi:WD40 repeat protein
LTKKNILQISQNDSVDGMAVIGEFDEGRNDHSYPIKLKEFLKSILPTILKELDENSASQAFNEYEVSASESSNDASWWKTLSVDLEKRKVVFPEWSTARHHPGSITNCSITRNKERLYDIEFDDGSKLSCVREDYIHWLGSADNRNSPQNQRSAPSSSASKNSDNKKDLRSSLSSRLQEGVRVHARVVYRNGVEKFVPARIDKVHRGGTYDVECEGGQIEHNMGLDDLMLGLQVGDMVEAKQPNKVHLQCTGLSWNSTGSTLAVAYGKDDILGWCDYPGAVCTWNVFGKQFDSANPDFVLDHNSCMMCVKCHPSLPALIAGGSFNGEIVVWDLSLSEPLYAVSPITEYGHKEPVLDIDWLYDPAAAEWVISSVGADGRVLLWTLSNKLLHPIKGALLTSKKGPTSSSSKRQPSSNHCGTCLAFCGASTGGTGAGLGGVSSALPKWYLVGEQGGGIVRGQIVRTLGSGNRLTGDSFKNLTSGMHLHSTHLHPLHSGSIVCLIKVFNYSV